MKALHYNNSSADWTDKKVLAVKLLHTIMSQPGVFDLIVDDGDGDVWRYRISVECDRLENVQHISEN